MGAAQACVSFAVPPPRPPPLVFQVRCRPQSPARDFGEQAQTQGVRLGTKPQVRADSFSAVRHTTASAAGDLGPSVPRLPPPKRAVLAPGPWSVGVWGPRAEAP